MVLPNLRLSFVLQEIHDIPFSHLAHENVKRTDDGVQHTSNLYPMQLIEKFAGEKGTILYHLTDDNPAASFIHQPLRLPQFRLGRLTMVFPVFIPQAL